MEFFFPVTKRNGSGRELYCSMLRMCWECVSSVLQCVAVCCSVLQCVAATDCNRSSGEMC